MYNHFLDLQITSFWRLFNQADCIMARMEIWFTCSRF